MTDIEENIKSHIEHTRNILDGAKESDLNEEATKRFLIQPFLENVLGWPMSTISEKGHVSSEYATEIVNQNKYIDYVLLDNDNELYCVVETKRGDENLKDKHKNQIKDYMKNEGVIWGILTNGTEFCFYVRDNKDSLIEKEINHFTYSSLDKHNKLLKIYSFESLISGSSENIREDILTQYRRKKEFDEEETKNTLYDLLDPRTSSERQLIDSFVGEFSNEIQHSKFDLNSNQSTLESDTRELINEQTSVTITNDEITFDENSTASGSLEEVVKALYESNKITDSDIPHKKNSTDDWYIFNSKPIHSNGTEMKRPKDIGESLFVECNRSTKNHKSTIRYLIESF